MARLSRSEAENRQVRDSRRVPKDVWINRVNGDWIARNDKVINRLCHYRNIVTSYKADGTPLSFNMAAMRGCLVHIVSEEEFYRLEATL